mmetsp:Transcript_24712/g.69378  ORF Transcript_24712/g.69378 Transcript_24712/m.69378 type:complete len:84 (+) Transcript_24712:59-310(+)
MIKTSLDRHYWQQMTTLRTSFLLFQGKDSMAFKRGEAAAPPSPEVRARSSSQRFAMEMSAFTMPYPLHDGHPGLSTFGFLNEK